MYRFNQDLHIGIFDSSSSSAKKLIEGLNNIKNTKSTAHFSILDVDLEELKEKCNAFFIDIFSFRLPEAISLIEDVRERIPYAPICLYSLHSNLAVMPGVGNYWRQRFLHYYKLPKDTQESEFLAAVRETTNSLSFDLGIGHARQELTALKKRIAHGKGEISYADIEGIVSVTLNAIEARAKNTDSNLVPGIETNYLKSIIDNTLSEAYRSIQISRRINISVIVFGSIVIAMSFVVASINNSWEAIAFGGFGASGIIAALITSPLKTISSSTGRLVQVQTAYFQFLLQLQMLNEHSDSIGIVEMSRVLGEVMERTVKILDD